MLIFNLYDKKINYDHQQVDILITTTARHGRVILLLFTRRSFISHPRQRGDLHDNGDVGIVDSMVMIMKQIEMVIVDMRMSMDVAKLVV